MAASILPPDFQAMEQNLIGLYDLLQKLDLIDTVTARMRCTQCNVLMLHVYQGTCGHHFCGPCIQNSIAFMNRCRLCQEFLNGGQVHRGETQLKIEREVAGLSVYCPYGCGNPCLLKEVLAHKSSCKALDSKPSEWSSRATPTEVPVGNSGMTKVHLQEPTGGVQKSMTPEALNRLKEEFVSKFRQLTEQVGQLREQNQKFEWQIAALKKEVDDAMALLKGSGLSRDSVAVSSVDPKYIGWSGRITWKIDHVTRQKWIQNLVSPEFYACGQFYKFRVEAYSMTTRNSHCLGFELVSVQDETDVGMAWPFSGNVMVTLVDKLHNPFQRVTQVIVDRAGSGCDRVTLQDVRVPLDLVWQSQSYMLDDCICLSIVVLSR